MKTITKSTQKESVTAKAKAELVSEMAKDSVEKVKVKKRGANYTEGEKMGPHNIKFLGNVKTEDRIVSGGTGTLENIANKKVRTDTLADFECPLCKSKFTAKVPNVRSGLTSSCGCRKSYNSKLRKIEKEKVAKAEADKEEK